MVSSIFKALRDNLKRFAIVWLLVLLANQLFIFHACFAPYCIAAAVPHTLLVAALVNFFGFSNTPKKSPVPPVQSSKPGTVRGRAKPRLVLVALPALVAIGIALAVLLKAEHPQTVSPASPVSAVPSLSSTNPSAIRNCLAQGIRLEGIRELASLDTAQKRARVEALHVEYEMRCAALRSCRRPMRWTRRRSISNPTVAP